MAINIVRRLSIAILIVGFLSASEAALAQEHIRSLPMDKSWLETGMFGESFCESVPKGLPRSGCKLLFEVLHTCVSCDDLPTILRTGRTQEQWLAYFKADRGSAYVHMTEEALTDMDQDSFNEYADKGALAELDWKQVSTLLAYQAINLPVYSNEVPKGGCTLLLETLKNCSNCIDLRTILSTRWTQSQWQAYFQSKGALNWMTRKQAATLLAYMAINMPMDEIYIPKSPELMRCFNLPFECQ